MISAHIPALLMACAVLGFVAGFIVRAVFVPKHRAPKEEPVEQPKPPAVTRRTVVKGAVREMGCEFVTSEAEHVYIRDGILHLGRYDGGQVAIFAKGEWAYCHVEPKKDEPK